MGSQLNRISQVCEASRRWPHEVRHSDLLPAPQHDTLPCCKPSEESKLSQVKTCEAMSQGDTALKLFTSGILSEQGKLTTVRDRKPRALGPPCGEFIRNGRQTSCWVPGYLQLIVSVDYTVIYNC